MEQANTNGKRILLVEDEPGIAKVYTRTLIGEGFQIPGIPGEIEA